MIAQRVGVAALRRGMCFLLGFARGFVVFVAGGELDHVLF